jgi:hypothetical protein
LGNIPERFCWLFFTEVRIRIHWILIRHQRFSWMLIGIRIHRPNGIRIRNTGFHILKNYWSFHLKKKINMPSNIWVRDPGSGKKPIPNPGSMGEKGTGSRIPDPQYWKQWKQPTNFIGTKINHHSLWHFLLILCSENLPFKSSKASDERNNICKCICWKCNPF